MLILFNFLLFWWWILCGWQETRYYMSILELNPCLLKNTLQHRKVLLHFFAEFWPPPLSIFPEKIASIILSLQPLFCSITFFSPSKIPRADNSEAHSLAALAAAHSFTGDVPAHFLLNIGLWKFNGVKPPCFVSFFLSSAVIAFLVCCTSVYFIYKITGLI